MIKKLKIDNSGYSYEVEIFYKDGVEQSEKSAEASIENIPFDAFKESDYSNITPVVAREFDKQHKPRPYLYRHGKERRIVQCNDYVPQELWNVEMYNYEREMEESKWH